MVEAGIAGDFARAIGDEDAVGSSWNLPFPVARKLSKIEVKMPRPRVHGEEIVAIAHEAASGDREIQCVVMSCSLVLKGAHLPFAAGELFDDRS